MHLLGRGLIVTAFMFALTTMVGAQGGPTKPIRMIGRIMQAADTRSMLTAMAAEAVSPISPEAFAAEQQCARDRFGVLVREAKIGVE
jgi:hypothetical protein